jgi:hypothetical protein
VYTVNHHLDKISAAIADLVTGKLSPLIIPPGDITTTLYFIQNHLSVQGFHVVRQSPQYYYKYGSFTVIRRNHSVFISLEFPITFHKEPFKLYKILSFSVPINDTSRDATQIVDINDYFLISADEHYHVSLPRSTINQCVCISLMICPIRPLLKTMKEPDCEAVLFQNKKTEIHSKCNFRFFRNIDKPHILDLTATQLLVYQTKDLTLQCKEGTKVLKGCDFCIMTVPCQCSIISANMRFDQQVKLCQKDTSDISILYPVNLALLQQFFNESQLTEILANTSFNKPVQVKISSFKIYEHKMSKLFAKDEKESLNLKKMAERTKKDQVIFSTLAESLVDGEITIDEEGWPKKEDVMSLMALIVGG